MWCALKVIWLSSQLSLKRIQMQQYNIAWNTAWVQCCEASPSRVRNMSEKKTNKILSYISVNNTWHLQESFERLFICKEEQLLIIFSSHSLVGMVAINSYSASHDSWCTVTLWNRIMTAQCEGMGEVGSARYEPALLPPCPTIRVLSYSNCQEIHSRQQTGLAV